MAKIEFGRNYGTLEMQYIETVSDRNCKDQNYKNDMSWPFQTTSKTFHAWTSPFSFELRHENDLSFRKILVPTSRVSTPFKKKTEVVQKC